MMNEQKKRLRILRYFDKDVIEYEKQKLDKILFTSRVFFYHLLHPRQFHQRAEEIKYLRKHGCCVFPYKTLKHLELVESGYDNEKLLPYVMHGGKRLYFPKDWTVEGSASTYRNFIENENILGGGYKEKSPHQYTSEQFNVKNTDVLFDVGSAEGLFALHHVDDVKKIYLIESDPAWSEALHATFAPFGDKVKIINKIVTKTDSETSITLTSLLEMEPDSSYFVKMDIEGYEQEVIESGQEMLKKDIDIRLACCTYHKHHDARDLHQLFTSMGYKTEFSDGYMLFIYDKLKAPYYRRGMIRAKK